MAQRRRTNGPGDPGEFLGGDQVQTALIDGNHFGIKAVRYVVVDDRCIVEGDISLGSPEDVAAQTEYLRQVAAGEIAAAVVISGDKYRWPSCRIPYEIDPALSDTARVTDAIAHWEANTSFRFILRTAANAATYPDYVRFVSGSGCSSQVGRRGGRQDVTLGSGCTTGNAIHEIGHVVGLWHEQSREDRDSFVTVNLANVMPGYEHNFDQHITDGDDVGAYDYGSIMHYPRDAFSKNGLDTIVPTNPSAVIGQRTALSAGDIAAANSFCPKLPTFKEHPKDIIFDTRKEQVFDTFKEAPFDTKKEQVFDTKKEQVLDTRKEQVWDTIKEGSFDPIGPFGPYTQYGQLGGAPGAPAPGALPFGVDPRTGGAAEPSGDAETLALLDQALEEVAGALAGLEAARAVLEQRASEIMAARAAFGGGA